MVFYCDIASAKELSKEDEALLCAAVAALRHLGVSETRGKGEVECRLFKGDVDITKIGIDTLLGKEA